MLNAAEDYPQERILEGKRHTAVKKKPSRTESSPNQVGNLKLSSLPRLESLKIEDNDIVHCNTASVNLTQLKMIDESPDLHSPYDESDSVSEKTPSFFSIPPVQN